MSERNFRKLLEAKWPETLLCVGLDTDPERISDEMREVILRLGLAERDSDDAIATGFNRAIILATYDLVCAYKPNSAFYEAMDHSCSWVLGRTMDYIHMNAEDVPVILDFKRGDIGNSNLAYMKSAFEIYDADAVTVHNYIGQESLEPFLAMPDRGIIVLCRTSNKGAGEFQDKIVCPEMIPMYQYVAHRVANYWNKNGNCGVVAGATYPDDIKEIRRIVGDDMLILIPGVGTQGGDLEMAVKNGINSRGDGIIVNASSSVLYKSSGPDFAEVAREEAKRLRDEINKYRKEAMSK